MSRIVKAWLNGFKARQKTYQFDGTGIVLTGPNGSGKSSVLEAIVYCLSGRVPAGRSPEIVARYFPPAGGAVTVYDEEGNWIRRGIQTLKGSVSETLETSDDVIGQPPDTSRWKASDVTLDIREFLSMSPERRREYVLALVGGGEIPHEKILAEIAKNYAAEIGAGTAAALSKPDELVDEEAAALAREWSRERGVAEVLASVKANGEASKTFLALGEEAKENRLAARRLALDGRAALSRLDDQVQGSQSAAYEVKSCRLALAQAQEAVSAAREKLAAIEQARQASIRTEHELSSALLALDAARQAQAAATNPPPKPEPPPDPDIDTMEEDIAALEQALRGYEAKASAKIKAERQLELATDAYTVATEQLEQHDESDMGQLIAILSEIPDNVHPRMPELCAVADRLAISWAKVRAGIEDRVTRAQRELNDAKALVTTAVTAETTAAVQKAIDGKALLVVKREELSAAMKAARENREVHRQAMREWEALVKASQTAAQDVARCVATVDALSSAAARAEAQIAELGEPPDLDAVELAAVRAQQAVEAAETAAGALGAYNDARDKATAAGLAESAWKCTERAIAKAREVLVGAVALPIVADINAVLEKAGRSERAYLDLETLRGKSIFDIGWSLNGTRVSLQSLSGGQSVLLCAALAVAFLKRAKGRRLLLIEGDPLDSSNLASLLDSLAPQAASLDVALVATARDVQEAEGWQVVHVG
jgi:energy-coupling factor transporter ATP-binding protein EcfA2